MTTHFLVSFDPVHRELRLAAKSGTATLDELERMLGELEPLRRRVSVEGIRCSRSGEPNKNDLIRIAVEASDIWRAAGLDAVCTTPRGPTR